MNNKILLCKTVCERMPWKVLQAILKAADLPVSKGVELTLQKLLGLIKDNKFTFGAEQQLLSLYIEHLKFGDKTVMFDSICSDTIQILFDNISDITIDIDPVEINYPYRDKETDSMLNAKHQLVEVADIDDCIYFYFASLKSLTEKITVDNNYLESLNARFEFPSNIYDVTAKRKCELRYYDLVCINKLNKSIEYRLDTSGGLPSAELDDLFGELKRAFIEKIRTLTPLKKPKELGLETRNLFKFVNPLYALSTDRVCELGFQVGAVTHNERMRSLQKDLRNEVFHKAGLDEVKSIDVFRIAVRKCKKIKNVSYESELYLPGTVRMMDGAYPLRHAVISNCIYGSDYRELVDSMDVCIKKLEKSLSK